MKELARWKQLENRLRKEPLLAKQFTETFEDLLAQGKIEYEGSLKGLKRRFETSQTLHEENVLLPLQLYFLHQTSMICSGLHLSKYSFVNWIIDDTSCGRSTFGLSFS